MDLNSLLLTIASLSASFVAILGGFIASRLITINSERASCLSQLQSVTDQLVYYEGTRSVLNRKLNEEDAIRYIYNHMAQLVEEEDIDDVYEDTELQSIDLEDLKPLWEKAQMIKSHFDDHLQSNGYGYYNSDWIPIEIAEEYTDDLFAYEFCKMYVGWGLGEHDFENTPFRATGKWYEEDRQKILDCSKQIIFLKWQKEHYAATLRSLKQPNGMKIGLILFALFSLTNIILPLTLSLFNFAKPILTVIAVSSILLLTIGLVATFFYLTWILKWKKEDQSQLTYQNLKSDALEHFKSIEFTC